jgi:hypothetical protein
LPCHPLGQASQLAPSLAAGLSVHVHFWKQGFLAKHADTLCVGVGVGDGVPLGVGTRVGILIDMTLGASMEASAFLAQRLLFWWLPQTAFVPKPVWYAWSSIVWIILVSWFSLSLSSLSFSLTQPSLPHVTT